jgi:chemotaxis protein CheX
MSSQLVTNGTVDKLVAAFCQSVEQTYETMVFLKVTCGAPVVKASHFPSGGISGTIGLTGDNFSGRLSLVFERPVAEQTFRSMMMAPSDSPVDENELKDVVGELSNMAAGGAKANLQQLGLNYVISIPTVVVGDNHSLESPRGCETIVVPVALGDSQFFMELSVA